MTTIAQFRVVDFGMEVCHLEFDPPDSTSVLQKLDWPDLKIKVYRLELGETQILDARYLSWSTRPKRRHLFEEWNLSKDGTQRSNTFPCPWGTRPAFEFQCELASCMISFWNDPKFATPGMYDSLTSVQWKPD